MPKQRKRVEMEQSYSPEFKLRVVLEYLRDPKHARRICHHNHISDELLAAWHQAFVARAGDIFGDPHSSHASQASDARYDPISYQTSIAADSESGLLWGIRINAEAYRSSLSPSTTKEPPAWLGLAEREIWYKRGIVIWDNTSQRMEVLSAREALGILDTLRQTDDWRKEGVPIIRQGTRFSIPESPERKEPERKPTKKRQKNKTAVQPHPERMLAEEELFRLDSKAATSPLPN